MSNSDLEEGKKFSPDFEKRGGLIPAVVQDASTLQIIMLAYMNREALDETVKSGMATFYSTSRKKLWKKGETSGDYLKVSKVFTDCDQDALVVMVDPVGGGACHTTDKKSGAHRKSCFYRKLSEGGDELIFAED